MSCAPRVPEWLGSAEEIESIINERFPTRLQYFKKSFPNAELNGYGVPTVCCQTLGLVGECPYPEHIDMTWFTERCCKCWNELMEDEKGGKL